MTDDNQQKIKGRKWDSYEFHTGTKALLVAKRSNVDIDDEVIQIGCNSIPVALIKAAQGKVGKRRITVPVVLRANKRLTIVGGERFGHDGWYEEQINDYAHQVIILSAPESEPEKQGRYVTPGLWECTGHMHSHSWIITTSGEWIRFSGNGYTSAGEAPEPDCHPSLVSDMVRLTGMEKMPDPVKVEVFTSATCCMTDMSSRLPAGHPDRPKDQPRRSGLTAVWAV